MTDVHVQSYRRRRQSRPKEPPLARALYDPEKQEMLVNGRPAIVRSSSFVIIPRVTPDLEGEDVVISARAIREAAASTLDDLLGFGVVPPTYIRKYPTHAGPAAASFQTPIEGKDLWEVTDLHLVNENDMIKIFILDFILGQTDRHKSNILIDKKGHAWAIDNEASLEGSFPGGAGGGYPADKNAAWKFTRERAVPRSVRNALKSLVFEDFITALVGVSRDKADAAWKRKLIAENWVRVPGEFAIKDIWHKTV